MSPIDEYMRNETRRHFFSRGANAVGWAALSSLLGTQAVGADRPTPGLVPGGLNAKLPGLAHFAPKAKQKTWRAFARCAPVPCPTARPCCAPNST